MTKITTKKQFDELVKTNPRYFEYYCSQCGNNARYNTPYVDSKGNIWCEPCTRKSPVMMQGVDQRTLEVDTNKQEFTKNHALVWREKGKLSNAWLKDGSQNIPIHNDEHQMDPETFLDKIIQEEKDGIYRCTTCKKSFKGEPAGYPLFAGICCADCMKKHSCLFAMW